MKGMVTEIASWLILGSLMVLVVTHPYGFSQAVSAIGSNTNDIMSTLTGKGVGAIG